MSTNVVVICGNLGKDAELTYTQNGKAVCKFSIAVNKYFKVNGENQQRTSWFYVVSFDKTAELIGGLLKKGDLVNICGELSQSTWKDKETGKERSTVEIRCHTFQRLSKSGQVEAPEQADDFGEEIPF